MSGIEYEIYNQYFLIHIVISNYVNNFPIDGLVLEQTRTCLHSLWNRETDMVFGTFPHVVGEVNNAEPIFPYFAMKYNWFFPCPKPFSRLQRISYIFSPSVWVAIVVVLFLVTVTSWCLANQSNDIRSYTTMSSALYNIWAVIVGVSVTGMPRSLRLKVLFVVFVLYFSAISTVFQTFLTSFLADPGYENQLASLDDILDSGIEFGYPEGSEVFFYESSVLRHKEVLERAEICSTYEVCIDRIRMTGNFALYAPVWAAQIYTNAINDHSTVCLLNDDDYDFFFLTTYVQKGRFFLESLNKFVSLYIESGMIHRNVKDSVYIPRRVLNNTDASDGYFVFNLSRLSIAFYILFFGHGVSFLLFLCEVFYHFRLRYV